ncbi:hypothetical protein VTN00DRAFT_2762 [Thermoascus crustaceus]|uniref:uncharacterized protein n=1 Tax=Thermoascus crustaceus TaxID=5088 RepID=UPI00374259B7
MSRTNVGLWSTTSAEAAVVGGNRVTSQRITDVILRCFDASAASQGCLNNLTFGKTSRFDAEMASTSPDMGTTKRSQVARARDLDGTARTASIGGQGRFRGGEGCIRDIEFREPLSAAILSDRRVHAPYGLHGGSPGAKGLNLFIKKTPDREEDRVINLSSKNSTQAQKGDRIVVITPGGGGWGAPDDGSPAVDLVKASQSAASTIERIRTN